MKGVVVFIIMENTLPNYIRKENLIHFELTEEGLRKKQFEHDNVAFFFIIEQEVMIPIMIQVIEI
jgi:hypothetical protein